MMRWLIVGVLWGIVAAILGVVLGKALRELGE